MKKLSMITTGVASVGALIFTASMVNAYQGDPSVQGPNYSQDRHEAMQVAFQTSDYQAWSDLMQNSGRITQVITEENFEEYASAHLVALDGDTSALSAFRSSLGLGQGNRSGNQDGTGTNGYGNSNGLGRNR